MELSPPSKRKRPKVQVISSSDEESSSEESQEPPTRKHRGTSTLQIEHVNDVQSSQWTCDKCTLINEHHRRTCSVCGNPSKEGRSGKPAQGKSAQGGLSEFFKKQSSVVRGVGTAVLSANTSRSGKDSPRSRAMPPPRAVPLGALQVCAVSSIARVKSPPASQATAVDVPNANKQPLNPLWVDECAPQSMAELAVHPKKLEEIKLWLQKATDSSDGSTRLLVLTGPPGCGKTTSIRVMAEECKIHLVEWKEAARAKTWSKWGGQTSGLLGAQDSQMNKFREFLLRSHSFRSLCATSTKQLSVIDDLPMTLDSEQQQNLLKIFREFVSIHNQSGCSAGAVLMLTAGSGLGAEHKWITQLCNIPGVSQIKMNPVADTILNKALKRVRNTRNTSKQVLSSAGGDIRAAINACQFSTGKQCDQDDRLHSFRALGRLLYPKPGVQPQQVVAASGMEPEMLNMFLHDNYLRVIQEDDIDTVAAIADGFASADTFVANPLRTRHAAAADAPDTFGLYSSILSSGSLVHFNVDPKKSRDFSSFGKPLSAVVGRSAAQRLKQANQCTSGLHHGFELVAEVLPTLAKLPAASSSTNPPTPNLEREFARALNNYSGRGWTSLDTCTTLDRTDVAMSDIVRRFTELETDLSATDELDPYKVLEDDDIDDF